MKRILSLTLILLLLLSVTAFADYSYLLRDDADLLTSDEEAQLEEKLGFARSSIYKWDKHCPSVEKVSKVADYFGVDIKYFLEE